MPDELAPPPETRLVILAALDGSDHSLLVSETAVAFAARAPRPALHFAHVIEATSDGAYPLGAPRPGAPSALAVVEKAERYVEAHARRAAGLLGEHVGGHVLEGEPRQALLQLGVDLGASLLIVGTEAARGLRRLLLGSVASSLVRDAPFPVLAVRTAAAELPAGLRPPCERCLESQRVSQGAELWCAEHAARGAKVQACPPPAAGATSPARPSR
jgi:nucleotide-binding universal stress UspA family protein